MTVYLSAQLFMLLLPRFGIGFGFERNKSCFAPFMLTYLAVLVITCTLYGIFYGVSRCENKESCNFNTDPLSVAIFFIAILQDLTEKHIETIAYSHRNLYQDDQVFASGVENLSHLFIFLIQFCF